MASSWLPQVAIFGPRENCRDLKCDHQRLPHLVPNGAAMTLNGLSTLLGPRRTHHNHDLAIKDRHTWSWRCDNGVELTFNDCHARTIATLNVATRDRHTWSQQRGNDHERTTLG